MSVAHEEAEPTAAPQQSTQPVVRLTRRHAESADLTAVRRGLPALLSRGTTDRVPITVSSLGTGYLGAAATSMAMILLLFDVGRFALQFRGYVGLMEAAFASSAWLLTAGLVVVLAVAARAAGDRLAPLVAWLLTAGLAAVVVLDVIAVFPRGDLGRDLTAAPATGLVLLAMVGVRSARSVLGASVVLFVVIVGCGIASWMVAGTVPPGGLEALLSTASRGTLPPILGALILAMFRRVVARELERVLVQSTVSAPRFAVGMLASEELARLDLAAEQLLDDVATARSRLPLNPASAQAAASLATELRLHLIEGRRQTWLYHAISESELLGRVVSLSDPESLAGLLDARQRDGLLQAVWLLLGDSPDRSRRSATRISMQVTVGRSSPVPATGDEPAKLRIPIVIATTGVPRNRVDPGTWDAVRRVGKDVDAQIRGSLTIEIDCIVDRPADR